MIYNIVDYDAERVENSIDATECEILICNLFEIKYDDKESLSKKLREIFHFPFFEMRNFLDENDISYATLIMVSRQIDPDFWTKQTIRSIQTRHKNLLNELDSNGNIKSENKIQNKKESKLILKRYFDLIPEENDWDKELSKLIIDVLRNDEKLENLIECTDLNVSTITSISFDLSPNFWNTGSGIKLKMRLANFKSEI